MVRVELRIVARPERRGEMVHALRALTLPIQAAPGFLSSRILQDVGDPDALYYVEEWQTAADLDRQVRSTVYTRLLALMEVAAEPPELRLNWVTAVRGLEYLAEVRLGAADRDAYRI